MDCQYKLWNDDCLKVFPDIEDKSIDLIMVDLPYQITGCKWDIMIPFDKLWEHYKRIIKPNGVIAFTATQPFTSMVVMSNLDWFKYEWIWRKPQGTAPMLAQYQPLRNHESVLIFYKNTPTYNPQMEAGTPYKGFSSDTSKIGEVYGDNKSVHNENYGTRYPKTVQDFKQDRDGFHPTQKPVSLMEYMIRTYTNKGDTVLDNTMGSGTTGVAAGLSRRNFLGIELDKTYFDTAEQRIKQAYKPNMTDLFL